MGRPLREKVRLLAGLRRYRGARYLDCGVAEAGFARLKCDTCGVEKLLMLSCKQRGLCPSCDAKRAAAFAAFLKDELLENVGHCLWTFTLPNAGARRSPSSGTSRSSCWLRCSRDQHPGSFRRRRRSRREHQARRVRGGRGLDRRLVRPPRASGIDFLSVAARRRRRARPVEVMQAWGLASPLNSDSSAV